MDYVRRVLACFGPTRRRRTAVILAAYIAAWALVALPIAVHDFQGQSRRTVVAGHDAVVHPTFDSWITLDLGPYVPNLRYPTGGRLGVDIVMGKTNLDSYQGLLDRYALIASRPDGEISKVTGLVKEMLVASVVQGTLAGLIGPCVWLLVGARRRAELRRAVTVRRGAVVAAGIVGALVVTAADPWTDDQQPAVADDTWQSIQAFLPETRIPAEAQGIQVEGGLVTSGTQRLIQSAFNGYKTSKAYYQDIANRVPRLKRQLRQPADGEVVALLVADRHDNVGMDPVARAIGQAGGASILFDAGDDTSTGEPWETFSLDSLIEAYEGIDQKFEVPGNHDEGSFVGDYLDDRGFTVPAGEPLKTKDGIVLLGAPDPRSSGLGNWRTDGPVSFDEETAKLGDAACKADANGERVTTLLVHSAALGYDALTRGCVDLILAGHLHIQVGPDTVVGKNGQVGVSYTNGTTGGAAYAVALGTKLRRDAEVTLVTYRDGRPIGLQPVWIRTTGELDVRAYWPMPQPTTGNAAPDVEAR